MGREWTIVEDSDRCPNKAAITVFQQLCPRAVSGLRAVSELRTVSEQHQRAYPALHAQDKVPRPLTALVEHHQTHPRRLILRIT
jgi:hypothetical protein